MNTNSKVSIELPVVSDCVVAYSIYARAVKGKTTMVSEKKSQSDWKPDVFGYLSYREFMRDYYLGAKENTRSMSFRSLSKAAGFGSPNFYKLVMDNQRNLSPEAATRISEALKLDAEEKDFFQTLVEFDQEDNREKKNECFERISSFRRFREAGRIEPDFFEYLSHWYYPTIREMTARADFRLDCNWISQQLHPKVEPENIERAIEVLLRLGFIEWNEGRIQRGEPSLTTGHEVNSLAIVNYHHQMMDLGKDSIESVQRELRDISALTMCVRAEQIPELKKRIHRFRETLMQLADTAEEPSTVYQLNVQLFPLNQVEDSENDSSKE